MVEAPVYPDPPFTLDRAGPIFAAHEALQRRLKTVFPVNQFAHHVVPARFSRSTWDRVAVRTPFVAVGWTGLKAQATNGRSYHATGIWHVFLGSKQDRVDRALVGDARGVGLLGMAGMAIATIHGQQDRGVGTWTAGDAENMYDEAWVNDDLCVVGVQATIDFWLTDDGLVAALPDLLRVGDTLHWPVGVADDLQSGAPGAPGVADDLQSGGPGAPACPDIEGGCAGELSGLIHLPSRDATDHTHEEP